MERSADNTVPDLSKTTLPGFEREYFIQTRKEIDTEKRERDRLLHFAILLLGGVSVVVLQKSDMVHFLMSPAAVFLEIPLLIILTLMFWLRWKKLSQIADRWYVLYHLLRHYLGEARVKHFLEHIVVDSFRTRRYVRKDFAMNLCLCFPIYVIMIVCSLNCFAIRCSTYGAFLLLLVVSHIVISFCLLWRPVKDPKDHAHE